MPVITKYHSELDEKPACKLHSVGSVMADDGDNVVWYRDSGNRTYEYHVKTGKWFSVKY